MARRFLPEAIQIAAVRFLGPSADSQEKFPISLGDDEIGVLLSCHFCWQIQTIDPSEIARAFLLRRELSSLAAGSYFGEFDKENVLAFSAVTFGVSTSGGSIWHLMDRVDFPYPIPFTRPPTGLFDRSDGSVTNLVMMLYYVKMRASRDYIASLEVKYK